MDLSEYHQHRLSGLPDPTHTISADTHHDPHRTHRPQQSLDLSAGHSRLSSAGSDDGRQAHEGRQAYEGRQAHESRQAHEGRQAHESRQAHEGRQAHESRSNSTTVRHRKPHHLDNANALSLSSQPYHMDDYVPTSKRYVTSVSRKCVTYVSRKCVQIYLQRV